MSLGQQQLPTPRPPTPAEELVWSRFLKEYEETKKTVSAVLSTAEVAGTLQQWLTTHQSAVSCFDRGDQQAIDAILYRFNTISRILAGATTHKYWASFENGDLTVSAPPTMPREEYQNDIYPGAMSEVGDSENLGVIWIPVLIGVALIAGAIVTVSALRYAAKSKDHEYRMKILDADLQMLRQPKEMQDAWARAKRDSVQLIERANKEHKGSWLESLIPGGFGGIAGAAVAILALLAGYTLISKRQ